LEGEDSVDQIERLKQAINYIEEHLETGADIRQAAQIACSSSYHFQRMFSFIVGVSVAEYIRRRKLSNAAFDLQNSDAKVIDVALKYGYDSPDAFTRAFKKLHGVTPQDIRKNGQRITMYPRISFHISIKGEKAMNYWIKEKEGFKIVGKKLRVAVQENENISAIPQFWEDSMKDGSYEKIKAMVTDPDTGVMGVCGNMVEDGAFDYFIAVKHSGENVPEGMDTLDVPKSEWAIFEAEGPLPGAIQEVWNRIYTEWFPSSSYEPSGAPELEVYAPGDSTAPDYKSYVWIPVIKKS
jgi:AraC family transcriptional regulator